MRAFTPARQLILDVLRMDGASPQVEMSEEDWAEFAELSRMHRLGPVLCHKLAGSDIAMPQEVLDLLQKSRRSHAMRNLKLYRELVTVARLFDEEGISFLALKGAYLARFAYPDPGLRPMRDLDLLLEPDDALRAFELLVTHGYQSAFGGVPEAYFADRVHLPPLRGPGGISIELHHRLLPPGMPDVFVEGMLARCVRRPLGGLEIAFPCEEDMLLHLCIHAVLDHRLDLGPLALQDVALLADSGSIDWQDFLQRVRQGNWQRCVLPVLYLARRHLGMRVPDEIIAALGGGGDEAAWLGSAEYLLFSDSEQHKSLDYGVQEIMYDGRFLERLSKLAVAIFPPRTVIARHFPVDAGSPFAYLYYPARWFHLVGTKLPLLLAAHAGRKPSMRELARQRKAFDDWLKEAGEP